MRMIFGLISLVITIALIAILAKKQLSAVTQLPATVPATSNSSAPANFTEKSKQMQSQVKEQLDAAMEAAAAARLKLEAIESK